MDPPYSFGVTLQLFRLRACEELVVGQAKALYIGPTFLKATPKRKKGEKKKTHNTSTTSNCVPIQFQFYHMHFNTRKGESTCKSFPYQWIDFYVAFFSIHFPL